MSFFVGEKRLLLILLSLSSGLASCIELGALQFGLQSEPSPSASASGSSQEDAAAGTAGSFPGEVLVESLSDGAGEKGWVEPPLTFSGLEQAVQQAPCRPDKYNHWHCEKYFSFVDRLMATNPLPDGCRTEKWKTDPFPDAREEQNVPGSTRVFFIDPCNLKCSNLLEGRDHYTDDKQYIENIRKIISNPETPLCDLRGLTGGYSMKSNILKYGDVFYVRRGVQKLLGAPVRIYSNPLDTQSGTPTRVSFLAIPGDEGLVTVRTATLPSLDKAGVLISPLSNQHPTQGGLAFYLPGGVSITGIRFLGNSDHGVSDKAFDLLGAEIPVKAVPQGRYYAASAFGFFGTSDLALKNVEVLWNSGNDSGIPTLPNCDRVKNPGQICYAPGESGGRLINLGGVAQLKIENSRIACVYNFKRGVRDVAVEPYLGSDGIKFYGFPKQKAKYQLDGNYFGDCDHDSLYIAGGDVDVEVTGNIFQNRLHTAAELHAVNFIFSKNLVYNISRYAPSGYQGNRLAYSAFESAQITENKFFLAGEFANGIISWGNGGGANPGFGFDKVMISKNIFYDETGKGGAVFQRTVDQMEDFKRKRNVEFRDNVVVGFNSDNDYSTGVFSIKAMPIQDSSQGIGSLKEFVQNGVSIHDNTFFQSGLKNWVLSIVTFYKPLAMKVDDLVKSPLPGFTLETNPSNDVESMSTVMKEAIFAPGLEVDWSMLGELPGATGAPAPVDTFWNALKDSSLNGAAYCYLSGKDGEGPYKWLQFSILGSTKTISVSDPGFTLQAGGEVTTTTDQSSAKITLKNGSILVDYTFEWKFVSNELNGTVKGVSNKGWSCAGTWNASLLK